MKKYLYFLLSILISHNALSVDRIWVGNTNNWATATNWSPSGIPDSDDVLTIDNPNIAPVIADGTDAHALRVFLRSNATLTIESGASLTVTNAERLVSNFNGITIRESQLTNNGTITVYLPELADGGAYGIMFEGGALTNSGIINANGDDGIQFSGVNQLTNLATGIINANGQLRGVHQNRDITSITNIFNGGVINVSCENLYTLSLAQGTFTNSGTIKLINGDGINLSPDATLNNLPCGRIIYENPVIREMRNDGIIVNDGLMVVLTRLLNYGNITNNGVLKYQRLRLAVGSTLTNNGIIIEDKTEPIVKVGTSNSASIKGIYTDQNVTTPAGTFTAPDGFSPSGLNPGDITLFAKIATSGNACEYIVPFVYVAPALPVTLASFTGKNTGNNQNELTWLTSEEKDFAYFEIQRSSDARSFEAIGSIHASQESSALKSYQFIDSYSLGMNYYRLKMVDYDGSYEFSKIVSVLNSVEHSIVGSFYPNPSNGPVFVDVYAYASETWQIRVFDTSGRVIKTESRILQKGMNKVPLSNLIKGTNIVQFENGKSSTSRVLVQQ
ncbi:T9SS type A sorting domain-containing protein [Dyadobacter sp. CY261]|uniref:T9SS type A sorting domain-containing protein n=1 Tax=Dyadobacter sp. CY261 TaxID=2907203 RepID=UPI001F29B046|nr:T9SS type A sorting domain-containing protein [Dyadobacter sp. CY261]MCF0069559.1 T9SS type A sorting domain-containing protein [Dyadobacter sp. CY261]